MPAATGWGVREGRGQRGSEGASAGVEGLCCSWYPQLFPLHFRRALAFHHSSTGGRWTRLGGGRIGSRQLCCEHAGLLDGVGAFRLTRSAGALDKPLDKLQRAEYPGHWCLAKGSRRWARSLETFAFPSLPQGSPSRLRCRPRRKGADRPLKRGLKWGQNDLVIGD